MGKIKNKWFVDIEAVDKKILKDMYGNSLPKTHEPPPPPDLTHEEKLRLGALQEERRRLTKEAKLNKFKELSGEMRQNIIDSLCLREQVEAINRASADTTKEEENLTEKHYRHIRYRRNSWMMMDFHNNNDEVLTIHSTPFNIELNSGWCGMTLEDLKRAHLDATMDEEVLKP